MKNETLCYFGYRLNSPKGAVRIQGPYHTIKEAKIEREKRKAVDADVSIVFYAKTIEEAEKEVHLFW